MMKKILLTTGLIFSSITTVYADDEDKSPWAGSTGYLGFSTTSGNSDTENLTSGLKFKYETGKWISDLGIDILRSSANDVDTAERYVVSLKIGYKFDDNDYIFYGSRYEKDNFTAFDYTMSSGVGWGHKFQDTETNRLITEIGVGYKIEALDIDRSENSGVALTGKLDYMRQLTDTVQFVDIILLEAISDNTYVQNDAGFVFKVSDKLNLNLVHQIKYNSDVPEGFDSTDTLLSVNIAYSF